MLAFYRVSVKMFNTCVTETKYSVKKKSGLHSRLRKNNHSLTDNELVIIVQNHMACSLFGMAILQCDMHSVDQQRHAWPRQQG